MKEATKNPDMMVAAGELNTTLVAVVAIGAIAVFFGTFVWPSIKTNILNGTKCASTTDCFCTGKTCKCTYLDEKNNVERITCPNKNE